MPDLNNGPDDPSWHMHGTLDGVRRATTPNLLELLTAAK